MAYVFRWELAKQSEVVPAYALGQVLTHRKFGYRGVIIGYDPTCLQTDEWVEQMGVERLPGGRNQPFYHVLVDTRDRPGEQATYVAEENVQLPDGGATVDAVEHPLVERYLTAYDAARGEYEPVPALRSLYPSGVAGCWMTDAVIPDGPAEDER